MSDSFNQEMETSKKKNPTIKKVLKRSDYCLFCEKHTTNLTQHVEKNHKNETEDTKFVALPIGSKERKLLAELLKKNVIFYILSKKEITRKLSVAHIRKVQSLLLQGTIYISSIV